MLGSPCGSVLNACATLTQLIIASFGGCKKVEDVIRCWMQNPGFFWLDRPCPMVNTSSAASSVKKLLPSIQNDLGSTFPGSALTRWCRQILAQLFWLPAE